MRPLLSVIFPLNLEYIRLIGFTPTYLRFWEKGAILMVKWLQRSVHLKSYYVQKWKSPLPSSTPGVDRQMCPLTFLHEIQFRTTFIWSFFDVMRFFGSGESRSESNFSFLYIIRFQIYWPLGLLSSTRGGDRHMRLGTFLYEIQFQITFIWSFF